MPEWTDKAIVLSSRPFGENNAVVCVLTASRGRCAGLVYAAQSRAKKGVVEVGNLVQVSWRARLDEQLGVFAIEMDKSPSSFVLDSPMRLSAIASVCALIDQTLPERVPHDTLFDALCALTELISLSDTDDGWLPFYIRWEALLLAQLGFSLDFERCAVTGETENLTLVSPRTGRAVTAKGAGEFAARMLALPAFLLPAEHQEKIAQKTGQNVSQNMEASLKSVADGLSLTGHFLQTRLFSPIDKPLPAARLRLSDMVAKYCETT